MKRDIPIGAGIGFTILIATATFAVAIVAGIFLINQSDVAVLGANVPFQGAGAPQLPRVSVAETPDIRRGAESLRSPRPEPGINPAPPLAE